MLYGISTRTRNREIWATEKHIEFAIQPFCLWISPWPLPAPLSPMSGPPPTIPDDRSDAATDSSAAQMDHFLLNGFSDFFCYCCYPGRRRRRVLQDTAKASDADSGTGVAPNLIGFRDCTGFGIIFTAFERLSMPPFASGPCVYILLPLIALLATPPKGGEEGFRRGRSFE